MRVEQDAVVQLAHRLRRLERGDVQQIERLQGEIFLRDCLGLQRVPDGVEPAYGARHGVGGGENVCQPAIQCRFRAGPRRHGDLRHRRDVLVQPGFEMQRHPVRYVPSAARRVDHRGLYGQLAAARAVERRGDAVVVALDSVVDAVGELGVRNRVRNVEQRVDRAVDRRVFPARARRQVAEGPGIAAWRLQVLHVLHQPPAIYDVFRFHHFDRIGRRTRGVGVAIGREWEFLAQGIDVFVDFAEPVAVVQGTLQLIAEQRTEALALADPLEERQRQSHTLR